jgi:poly-gamma-glutamate capsule biosynthesis protein CapA/YwtB (metallophosphatase superfamily)
MGRHKFILVIGFAGTLAALTSAQQPPDFTFALTGDSIITRRLSVYTEPTFTRLMEMIRGADAAFTNLEMLFHDYEPYAMNESGGTYMRGEPALVKELVWAGFDMVSRANNHTGDYGVLGMDLTTKYVAAAGLVQAGVGHSLGEAREAKFLETAKGRVALISVASTFPDHSRAGRTRGDMPARPGLNPLRFTTTNIVTAEHLAQLRGITAAISGRGGQGAGGAGGGGRGGQSQAMNFYGRRFEVGPTPGIRTEPNKEDLDEIAAVVKNASGLADYTIVTIHAHEGGQDRLMPAEFLVTFARAMVDAGADMFVGHGPHVLRAVEIYKGKPILYSLGDFIFQNETLLRLPSENYESYDLGATSHVNDFNDRRYNFDKSGFPADRMIWEAVVAMPTFRGEQLTALALHPITLGFGKSRSVRGRPMLAEGELGQKILGDLVKLSSAYGTKITIRNGVGHVELGAPSSQ